MRLTLNQFYFFIAELKDPFSFSDTDLTEEIKGDPDTHEREKGWLYFNIIIPCPYDEEGKKKRINTLKLLKCVSDIEINPILGANRFDDTIYVPFQEVYKMLIRRAFENSDDHRGKYEIKDKSVFEKLK